MCGYRGVLLETTADINSRIPIVSEGQAVRVWVSVRKTEISPVPSRLSILPIATTI
jgi:hypothetical protein